ncbi:hypothetical protein BN1723_007633 [Verticillium longisporum]|uniref:Uncharacterized protein n=1 Tax=Verticillium longisporum TaxID=100787 RepID=A0A0G4NMI5_VERLO|nr:hypothetical protein BN1723_007633 [Verticillium longisporum]
MYEALGQGNYSYPGYPYIRTALDTFKLNRPDSSDVVYWNPAGLFSEELLKAGLIKLFLALDYLHSECKIIYIVRGNKKRNYNAQLNVYRSPKDLFKGIYLFQGNDPKEKRYLIRAYLAELVALLGPPPTDLLRRRKRSSEFFVEDRRYPNPAADKLREIGYIVYCNSGPRTGKQLGNFMTTLGFGVERARV